jgi:predicted glycogen debranching enzyme
VYRLPDGTRIRHELVAKHGEPRVALSWEVLGATGPAPRGVLLTVRPLVSGRDYHALHRRNSAFRFDARVEAGCVVWHPYPGVPGIVAWSNGGYAHDPAWFDNFHYREESSRGFGATEDLASPGAFRFDLSGGRAALVFAATGVPGAPTVSAISGASGMVEQIHEGERDRRAALGDGWARAADAYIVKRGEGKTIVAGYPWFTDWGRDTFIAVRGLCMATGRWEDAKSILLAWAGSVSAGRMPNRFLDHGEEAEFNTVDAALWFVIAAGELLQAAGRCGLDIDPEERSRLQGAISAIMERCASGSDYGVRLDTDGLLAAGRQGVQLTWMDARVGERVITPRIGKPVEVQALWLNSLHLANAYCDCWGEVFQKGLESFRRRFVHPKGYLYDVVDVNHVPGEVDATFRPNQLLAVGGLPVCLLSLSQAKRVVDQVERKLLSPLGLRSLDPESGEYVPRYEGGPAQRDAAFHQGTAWAWLMGPFVEAWVRVRGGTAAAKKRAREKFLVPLVAHLDEAGLGHVSEIADAEHPHTPRGCPFQAWSLGELIRLDRVVLAGSKAETPNRAWDRAGVSVA